jgi:hypothetical protein
MDYVTSLSKWSKDAVQIFVRVRRHFVQKRGRLKSRFRPQSHTIQLIKWIHLILLLLFYN